MGAEAAIETFASRLGIDLEAALLVGVAAVAMAALLALRLCQEMTRAVAKLFRAKPAPTEDAGAADAPPATPSAPAPEDDAEPSTRTLSFALGPAPYGTDMALSDAAGFVAQGRLDAARQAAMAARANADDPAAQSRSDIALADIALARRDSGAALTFALRAERAAETAADARLLAHARARQGLALRATTDASRGESRLAEAEAALRALGLDGEADELRQGAG